MRTVSSARPVILKNLIRFWAAVLVTRRIVFKSSPGTLSSLSGKHGSNTRRIGEGPSIRGLGEPLMAIYKNSLCIGK